MNGRLTEVDASLSAAEASARTSDFTTARSQLRTVETELLTLSRDAEVARTFEADYAELASLRAAAVNPDARADAQQLERDAQNAADQGRYVEAISLVGRAAAAWTRAAQPVASSTPEPAPAPVQRPPREIATEVLGSLASAMAAEDMTSVRRVWTSISSEEAQGLEQLFSSVDDLDVDYAIQSIRQAGDRISVAVNTTYAFRSGGQDVSTDTSQEFEIEERAAGWVIVGSR